MLHKYYNEWTEGKTIMYSLKSITFLYCGLAETIHMQTCYSSRHIIQSPSQPVFITIQKWKVNCIQIQTNATDFITEYVMQKTRF